MIAHDPHNPLARILSGWSPLAMDTLVIAHRGDSAHAPENTLPAFAQAVAKGCDWIETDLQLSADGVVVSFHDDTLDRLTGESGRPSDHDAAHLRTLRVRSGAPDHPDARICTLDEILAGPGREVPFYLELKASGDGRQDPGNARLLAEVLERVPADTPHAVASFDADLVRGAVVAGRPGILIANTPAGVPEDLLPRLFALSLRHRALDSRTVQRASDLGVAVWAWTVDRAPDVLRCLDLGVTGICTNDPAAVRSLLAGTA